MLRYNTDMTYEESCEKIRQILAKNSNTNPEDWFLCMKARFGMAVVFNALRDIKGDGKVLTTPYTCITAINPILISGLTPVYQDITPEYLSTYKLKDTDVDKKTLAIVMQHTLGMIGDKTRFRKFADKHNLILIEDSSHCVTRFARDEKDKILADISIHSFGVEKILVGSKFGGAIYLNPELKEREPDLYELIAKRMNRLKKPGKITALRVRTYRHNNALLQRLPARLRNSLRSAEIKAGLLEPAVYPFEQDAQQDEPLSTNTYINKRIISQLETLKPNYIRRHANVDLYRNRLKSSHFKLISKFQEPLLAFPILFENAEKAQKAYEMLTSSGYFIRRWYYPLIYPGPNKAKLYRYDPKKTPIAEKTAKCVLCLPTDLPIIQTNQIIRLINDQKTEK